MKVYLRILNFAKPFDRFIGPYLFFMILAVAFGLFNITLIIPLLNVLFNTIDEPETRSVLVKPAFEPTINFAKDFFNYHLQTVILENGKIGALRFVCILVVISVFFSNLFRYLGLRIEGAVRAQVVRNLRQAVYHQITKLHLGYFSDQRKGDLMSRLTNDVQEVENSVVSTLTVLIREPLLIAGYFTLLFTMSAKLTLFTLLLIPVSGFIISEIAKRLKRKAKQGQESLGTILSIIDETLGGIRIIKAFNARAYITEKFDRHNNRYARIMKSMSDKRNMASPISEFLGVSVVAIILYYGGSLVLNQQSELSASEFIAYIILFSQVLVPIKAISTAFSNIQRGLVSGDRILTIIDTEPTIYNTASPKKTAGFRNQVEFRHVSFEYDATPVLKDISLIIPKGKTIALVGASGSGKSTLADLLPRFYDPTQGAIYLDGTDIRELDLTDLRNQMGIVTQEPILFNDTIFSNIAFNKTDATEAEVTAAAKIANAHEFIMQSPDGYYTMIGDRGGKLSGGQKQRISIARAILKNPPILILDEATSALDTESEKLVQEALTNLMKNRTSLVIAHRLSTIRHADEILVMQHGQIVERGNHEELLARQGIYARLSQMQLTSAPA